MPTRHRLLWLPPMVSGMLTYGCGQSRLVVVVVKGGESSEGKCGSDASSSATVAADVSLGEVSAVFPGVG